MTKEYESKGYSSETIEFGQKPAILVVDLQLAFTDPEFPNGDMPMVEKATNKTSELLHVARSNNIPVASCYTAYDSLKDMPLWKVKAVREEFYHGHPCTAMDSRVYDPEYDFNFCKNAPSMFFLTPLTTFLHKEGVDTVIVTGCVTSGCIRATVIDAFSHGFRVFIPEDCVGDVEDRPHNDNLRDMSRRYGEVIDSSICISYINNLNKS